MGLIDMSEAIDTQKGAATMSEQQKELAREYIRKHPEHPSYEAICHIPPMERHPSMRCLPDKSSR
jgi:hypothetical protein